MALDNHLNGSINILSVCLRHHVWQRENNKVAHFSGHLLLHICPVHPANQGVPCGHGFQCYMQEGWAGRRRCLLWWVWSKVGTRRNMAAARWISPNRSLHCITFVFCTSSIIQMQLWMSLHAWVNHNLNLMISALMISKKFFLQRNN